MEQQMVNTFSEAIIRYIEEGKNYTSLYLRVTDLLKENEIKDKTMLNKMYSRVEQHVIEEYNKLAPAEAKEELGQMRDFLVQLRREIKNG